MVVREFNLGKYYVPDDVHNGVCVDMGANVGSFTEKYITFFSKIYYFEAQERLFNEILNKKFINETNVFGFNLAGYSKGGVELEIIEHKNEDSGSSAIKSEYLNNGWTNNIINKVKTISLEEIYDLVGKRINFF